MASSRSLTPTLPPTANLTDDFTNVRLLYSFIYAAFSTWFLKLSLLFCNSVGPQIPWPKKNVSINQKEDESSLPLIQTITIVTGANSGIGYEIAKAQFQKGSNVILACRSIERGESAIQCILNESSHGGNKRLQVLVCDTSSLESIRAFVQRFKIIFKDKRVDFLFLNAGVAQKPKDINRFTSEGLEYMYVTNFLGHFLLTGLLSSMFSENVRIISTSSIAALNANFNSQLHIRSENLGQELETGFHTVKLNLVLAFIFSFIPLDLFHTYGQGKAMQVAFNNILQNRFDKNAKSKNIPRHKFTASFHPGYVSTNIFKSFYTPNQQFRISIAKNIIQSTAISPKQGAQTGLWLAHTFDALPGAFYDRNIELVLPWYKSFDDQLADRLWQRWNNDAGLKDSDWCF